MGTGPNSSLKTSARPRLYGRVRFTLQAFRLCRHPIFRSAARSSAHLECGSLPVPTARRSLGVGGSAADGLPLCFRSWCSPRPSLKTRPVSAGTMQALLSFGCQQTQAILSSAAQPRELPGSHAQSLQRSAAPLYLSLVAGCPAKAVDSHASLNSSARFARFRQHQDEHTLPVQPLLRDRPPAHPPENQISPIRML